MSTGSSIPLNLGKLTVVQLKALCKERRITGYSKLSKAALLQKLVGGVAAPDAPGNLNASTPAPLKGPVSLGTNAPPPSSRTQDTTDAPEDSVPPAVHREESIKQVSQETIQDDPTTLSLLEGSATNSLSTPANLPESSLNPTSTTKLVATPRNVSSIKRTAHIDISPPPKRNKRSLLSRPKSTISGGGCESSVHSTIAPRQTFSVTSSVFKVPELPAVRGKRTHNNVLNITKQTSLLGIHSNGTIPHRIPGSGRFKPLTVSKPGLPLGSDSASRGNTLSIAPCTASKAVDSAFALNVPKMPAVLLFNISLPPRASERKWVHRWAIILSALSAEDREACCLVSRTFRYAVYLSATHILSKFYPGRRLDAILQKYPQNMTNFWPYFRLRRDEVFVRRQAFRRSFLGRYTDLMCHDPLHEQLWGSPDDEKQVEIALRFVLTRMWFAVSIGAYGHDSSAWTRSIVKNVREVVTDEIWQVDVQCSGTTHAFYVLEATCEVIGHPPLSEQSQMVAGQPLRADWTAYIFDRLSRSSLPAAPGPCSLLRCVKWSNLEEYHRGISKAWFHRVSDQDDAEGITKKGVAEKYILASVVANGLSGRWMSTSAMAQEFAGLPGNDAFSSRTIAQPVNMYLPAHHHVESIHFITSKGEDLHRAVAVVQTPAREYYILRENGMQVGCEEDGVAEVWQQILRCDNKGRAV
ncbi:hypothetical protein PAXRUDRAFT_33048 [Paxillus rubicundulus Ve08.2h10]|uniref:Rho termination factor N-terminal domain-containing protein n=1 Tax=Paxillus rubicundulus Ve08.2h10 TaxID=930991 RepID=A0A0D0E395_9AGAM|nr:hypothetical protein PAXRUDRAFT_33048 [Paxillus rubicundulus Ve08.2h10]